MARKRSIDVEALRRVCIALESQEPRMREATLRFAWDKYVTHADTAPDQTGLTATAPPRKDPADA